MDTISHEARSKNMSRIKGRNTKPEMYIRSLLFKRGMRYRVNVATIAGKPDLYFSKLKTAIFIHGCFWHRHSNCCYAYTPKTNTEFWITKLENNHARDEMIITDLRRQGIRTLVIWECTIKKMQKDNSYCNKISEEINSFIYKSSEWQKSI